MNKQGLADELNDLLATESRSLAQHLEEAQPYLDARTFPVWKQMEHLADLSRDHAARLSHLIDDFELPPRPRPFSPDVANYHYMDLACLLPLLIEEKRRQIAAYHRAVTHAAASPKLLEALTALASENEKQLDQLEAFYATVAGN